MSAPALPFLHLNQRQAKPRSRGLTEIRGPYYTPIGKRYLEDVLKTMGVWVDGLKFAGGSFALMPRRAVEELLNLCHAHDVRVSTGGFIEFGARGASGASALEAEGTRDPERAIQPGRRFFAAATWGRILTYKGGA